MAKFGGLYLEVGEWDDVVACRDFYAGTLGFRVASELEGESVWFDAGGLTFGFHTGDAPPKEMRWAVNLVLDVDVDHGVTVDSEASRLKDLGVRLFMEPTDMDWGHRVITFLDPAGHAVWYCQPLT